MSRLRLVFVTRRFRPLPGGLENTAMRLLGELARRGHSVTVVTPKWQADWAAETDYAGVHVVRIAPPGGGCWGEARFARRLSAVLNSLRGRVDIAWISGMRVDAYTALRVSRRLKLATVLQPERPGVLGDCHWQIDAPSGRRIKRRCFSADAILAWSPLLQRELTAAGYARPRIHRMPLGVPLPTLTTLAQREEARRNIALADPVLALQPQQKLVAYVGRLRLGKGLDDLLAAWRRLLETHRHAVLWLVGEGPDAGYLRDRVIELGLLASVRLTGAFDDVEDVFRAAELCVFPSLDEGLAIGALEAASYGLPIVASNTAAHRELFRDAAEIVLCEKNDPQSLAVALASLLDDSEKSRQLGAAARRRVAEEHSLSAMVEAHENVLQSLGRARLEEAVS